MAQIVITFDTLTKEGSITIDGAEMADVTDVSLYRYDKEWGLRVESHKVNEDQKMSVRSVTYAELDKAGFQEDSKPEVVQSIHEYFGVE